MILSAAIEDRHPIFLVNIQMTYCLLSTQCFVRGIDDSIDTYKHYIGVGERGAWRHDWTCKPWSLWSQHSLGLGLTPEELKISQFIWLSSSGINSFSVISNTYFFLSDRD